MNNIITAFKNIKDTNQPFHKPLSEVLKRIKDGVSRELVNKIRFEDDKTARNLLKQDLPSICFSGKFRKRKDDELIEHSGLICLDFDGYETTTDMVEAKKMLSKDKYSLAVFVSPSGKGLKVIVKIPKDPDNHQNYFNSLKEHYNSDQFDPTSKNISRVCYESYDPDIYINEDSSEWTYLGQKEYKEIVRNRDSVTVPITDDSKVVEILLRWWTKEYPMSEGSRNENAYVLASALNDYGVSKENAMNVLLQYQEKSFPQSEIRATVNSAYSRSENFNTKYFEDEERLNNLRSDMRGGASRNDINQQLKGMNIDESMADQISDKLEREVSGDKFWKKSDKGVVKIIHISFKRFLEKHGFFKYNPEGSKSYVFVRVVNNLIDHTTEKDIKTFVLDYLLEIGDDSVYNYFAEKTKYFKEDFLTFLASVDVHFVDDEKDTGYIYFKNVAVKITPKKIYEIDYIDLGGYVWRDHVMDRDFKLLKDHECDFKKFISNVCFSDERRTKSMESTIGYLLHGYKPPSQCPSVILNDEVISDNPEGGTGKGIIMKAISHIKKMVVIDGKDFDFGKSFPYQLVSADTQIIVFDDVKNRFDFERLFSVVTEGITLEKKNKDAIKIPFSKSPKIGITTNYAIRGTGSSFDRRKWELELHQYYSAGFTPYEEFGKYMFDEWNEEEWMKFDNYMIECLRSYMNTGLVKSEFVNLKIRKLSAQTCHEFIEWCGIVDNEDPTDKALQFIRGHKVFKSELYSDFVEENPDFGPKSKLTVSRNKFYKWLIAFCLYKGKTMPDEGRDANGRWIRLITRHEYEEDGKIEFK